MKTEKVTKNVSLSKWKKIYEKEEESEKNDTFTSKPTMSNIN